MKKIISIIFLFFFCLNLLAEDYKLDPKTSTVIPNFHGTILLIKGKARRINKENPFGVNLEKGQRIFSGDTIESMPASSIKFQLTDDTMIALGANSTFVINKYDFQDKDKRQASFNLIKGQLRATIHRLAKVGDLEFYTQNISMGVLGTEFLLNENENNTQLALLSGKLEVMSGNDKKKQTITSGQNYLRSQEGIKIIPITSGELKRLKAEHLKEEDEFRPFLEFAKNNVNTGEVVIDQAAPPIGKENLPEKDQWKKSLEQLNEILKENNKQK